MKSSEQKPRLQVHIAPLQADDLEELSDLATRTYIDTFGQGVDEQDLQQSIESLRSVKYFKRAMHESVILVAKLDDKIVGYVQFGEVKTPEVRALPKDRELGRVYVDTGLQSKGIGRQLVDAAFAHPQMKAAPHIYLQVWDQNVKAKALYESYGFKTIGRTKFTIGASTPAEDLIMILDRTEL